MEYLFTTIGISGSGKSHYFKNEFEKYLKEFLDEHKDIKEKVENIYPKNLVVEPDNFRKTLFGDVNYAHDREPWLWDTVTNSIKYRLDKYGLVVLDSCLVQGSSRSKFLKDFPDAHKTAIVFQNSFDVSSYRINKDVNFGLERSNVPIEILESQNMSFIRSVIGDYVDENTHKDYEWNEETEDKIRKRLSEKYDNIIIIKNDEYRNFPKGIR